jgi:hypothetical protein
MTVISYSNPTCCKVSYSTGTVQYMALCHGFFDCNSQGYMVRNSTVFKQTNLEITLSSSYFFYTEKKYDLGNVWHRHDLVVFVKS